MYYYIYIPWDKLYAPAVGPRTSDPQGHRKPAFGAQRSSLLLIDKNAALPAAPSSWFKNNVLKNRPPQCSRVIHALADRADLSSSVLPPFFTLFLDGYVATKMLQGGRSGVTSSKFFAFLGSGWTKSFIRDTDSLHTQCIIEPLGCSILFRYKYLKSSVILYKFRFRTAIELWPQE